ncbi:dATP/dGTP pyrophosphohydrolase domain-containing protein, partial [Salmonella enterica]|uniref:dATP/dGTP pyrophosphohydrolase domain-containing protein n=1 Tax=Salmonella enterica TaxID=28901 RepID=UPI0020CDA783
PSDPLEWADMQFLLWDAQRRMGISDEFITRAMIEKLEINKSRQWPEPKDGEPRLHIKEQPAPVVPEEMPAGLAGQIVSLLAHNIGDKFLAQKIWNACRAVMQSFGNSEQLYDVGSWNNHMNTPTSQAGNSPVTPDCWCRTCRPVTMNDMRFVVCPECGNKRCPHANDHRNDCTGSNEPGQVGSAYPAAPQQEVKP